VAVIAAILSCAWAAPARGGPVVADRSQVRRLFASIGGFGVTAEGEPTTASDEDTSQAPGFGTFEGEAVASITLRFLDEVGNVEGPKTAQTLISQQSTLGGGAVHARGEIMIPSIARGEPGNIANAATARVDVQYVFELLAAHDFVFSSLLRPSANGNPSFARASLVGPRGDVFRGGGDSIDFDSGSEGVLTPGVYTLDVTMVDSFSLEGAGGGAYDIAFAATPVSAPVPLPPAAWPTLVTASIAAGWRTWRGRRSGQPWGRP
jgi:hypothetical protein